MTIKFQAGVGPGQNACHVYVVSEDPDATRMSLCERVVIARNYKADLVLSNARMCKQCAKLFLIGFATANPEWMRDNQNSKCPPASALGVSYLEL